MLSVYFDIIPWKIAVTQALCKVYEGARWSGISPLQVAELPDPELGGPGWVKVKIHSCGLCGSDMHMIGMDLNPRVSVAAIPGNSRIFLGHEIYGEVVEAGPDAVRLKVGDKVSFNGFFPNCGSLENEPCPRCAEGNYTLCLAPHKGKLPMNRGGGFSEYMVAHESQFPLLPSDFTESQALFVEPIAVAVHAVLKETPQPGDRVLVIGAGTVGLNTLQVLKAFEPEARVTVMARYEAQAVMAKTLGADKIIMGGDLYEQVAEDSGGKLFNGMFGSRMILGGYDIVHDSIGSGRTIEDALRWVKSRGAVIFSGVELGTPKLDMAPVWHQEIRITGINCHGQEGRGGISRTSFDEAVELIQGGKVRTSELISHRFPIGEIRRAVEVMTHKDREPTFKIVIEMGGDS
jgi:threonine dehydrogenase-like Zn-dependent dehydrogenase